MSYGLEQTSQTDTRSAQRGMLERSDGVPVWSWADGAVYFDAQANFKLEAKKALDAAGIEIPFPHHVEIRRSE